MTLEGLVTETRPVLVQVRDLPPLTEATAWFASPQFTRSVDRADRLALLRRGSFAHGCDKYVLREAFDSLLVLPVTRAITNW